MNEWMNERRKVWFTSVCILLATMPANDLTSEDLKLLILFTGCNLIGGVLRNQPVQIQFFWNLK